MVSMGRGKPLMVAGWDHNLIKIGLEETVQRDMENLEGGEAGGCEAKRPEGWSGHSQSVR